MTTNNRYQLIQAANLSDEWGPPQLSIGSGHGSYFEAVEYKTLEWVDWFNHQRLLEPIGNIPPAEAEANYYAALESIKMAA